MSEPSLSTAATKFLQAFVTNELPDLGPHPRHDRLTLAQVDQRLASVREGLRDPVPLRSLLQSAALLWHDHLDESHTLSQSIHSADGSFLHGIMHRREPDYGNARYWFHRMGRHAAFESIGRTVAAGLQQRGNLPLANRLAPGGEWDPFAFVDACEEAADARADSSLRKRLQEVQRFEFECLVAHLLR